MSTDLALRAVCIHGRYDTHKVDNPELCPHGSRTMHVHNEWACAGPRNEWCPGGREVTELAETIRAKLASEGIRVASESPVTIRHIIQRGIDATIGDTGDVAAGHPC